MNCLRLANKNHIALQTCQGIPTNAVKNEKINFNCFLLFHSFCWSENCVNWICKLHNMFRKCLFRTFSIAIYGKLNFNYMVIFGFIAWYVDCSGLNCKLCILSLIVLDVCAVYFTESLVLSFIETLIWLIVTVQLHFVGIKIVWLRSWIYAAYLGQL